MCSFLVVNLFPLFSISFEFYCNNWILFPGSLYPSSHPQVSRGGIFCVQHKKGGRERSGDNKVEGEELKEKTCDQILPRSLIPGVHGRTKTRGPTPAPWVASSRYCPSSCRIAPILTLRCWRRGLTSTTQTFTVAVSRPQRRPALNRIL